jgi:hypothetical protein
VPQAQADDQKRPARAGAGAGRAAGFETHGTRAAFRSDRAKDAALTASGYRVLRFTKDVEPELVVRRLRALLA